MSLEATTINRILEFIHDNPGCHLRQIKNNLDLAMGTVQYRLDRLEKMDLITSYRRGQHRFYFPDGICLEFDKHVLEVLCHERAREILLLIISRKNPTQTDIVNEIGISGSAINWNMQRLIDLKIVEETRDGRYKRYRVAGGNDGDRCKQILKMIKNYYPSLWNNLTYRITELFISTE